MTPPEPTLSAIGAILEKVRRYPQLRVENTASAITVHPESPDGFPARLDQHRKGCTVSFAGWHEHFESDEEAKALNCFAFGLSEQCRLRVLSRGSFDYC